MINDFHDLKNTVLSSLDIYTVMNWYNVSLNRSNKSRCIIHNSEKCECFHINKQTERYTCYSCGATGDKIDFIQAVEGVDFVKAIYIAGYNLGLISIDECNNKRINGYGRSNLKAKELKVLKPVEKVAKHKTVDITEEEIIRNSNVYNTLAYICKLKDKDREMLLEERKIRKEKVEEYFTIKINNPKMINELLDICKRSYNYTKEDVAKVPGFYLDEDNNLNLNNKMETLAIKLKDASGRTRIIQVKNRYAKEGDVKYFYLSSGNIKNGNKANLYVDVIYPNYKVGEDKAYKTLLEESLGTVLITEGKFKGEVITDTFNCPTIAIPGIKTFEDKVKTEINNLNKMKKMMNTMIMLDSDMIDNFNVGQSVIDIIEKELKDISFRNIYVVVWDPRHGKGIDDVILNGKKDELRKLKADYFVKAYRQYIEDTKDRNRKDYTERDYVNYLYRKYILNGELED